MKLLNYTCKLCRRPGVAKYDPSCEGFQIGLWASMLTCNACSDHRVRVMKRADQIRWIAGKLPLLYSMKNGADEFDERKARQIGSAVDKIRGELVTATRQLAEFSCRHHRKAFNWDVDFVNQIMERPEKAVNCCWLYDRMTFNDNLVPSDFRPLEDEQ